MDNLIARLEEVANASEQWAGYGERKLTMSHGELAKLMREAAAVLREVAVSGVEQDDPRLDYVTVQIDRATWEAIKARPREDRPMSSSDTRRLEVLLDAALKAERAAREQERNEHLRHSGQCAECGTWTCGYCGVSAEDGRWHCEKCWGVGPLADAVASVEAAEEALKVERAAREYAEELLQRSCEQRAALRDELIEAEEALKAERAQCAAIAREFPELAAQDRHSDGQRHYNICEGIAEAIEARGEEHMKENALANELVELLLPYAGDGGTTEGAVECLRRLLREVDEARGERPTGEGKR
jgi:hypothetical protein